MAQTPMIQKEDKHLTIRVSPKTAKAVDTILQRAWREDLQVQGRSHPIRVKHSHIFKMAVEIGVPLALQALRDMQKDLVVEEG